MSEEHSNASGSIRVNLRFGKRTDPSLWRALCELEPYARAKLVRKLMFEAWRARQKGEPLRAATQTTELRGAHSPESGAQLADDILSLVGGAVRL